MKLCMIGTGYVGLVSGVCFSDLGNTVYCVDKNKEKINSLNNGLILFWLLYEKRAVRITPPLTISNSEIKKGCKIILSVLDSI